MRHRAAIDRDDQAGSAFRQLDKRLARRTIAFQQAIRNVMARLDAQLAQQTDQKRRAGGAVDVVVAIDRDRLTAQNGLRKTLGRAVHIGEDRRIGQKRAHGGLHLAVDVILLHAAGKQQLTKQARAVRRHAKRHVPAAPLPRPP